MALALNEVGHVNDRTRGFVVVGVLVATLAACGSSSHPAAAPSTTLNSSSATSPETTTSFAPTIMTSAATGLAAFLAAHVDAVVHSGPIPYGRTAVAVIGIEDGLHNRVIAVVSIVNGTARQIASLTLPYPYYDFARNRPIQDADITGDGASDTLVRFVAADNDPGVVVSADGGSWHLVPESSNQADVYIGRNPTIENGRLTSMHNDCLPSCAQGHTTMVNWRYDRQHRYLAAQ
jgi:ABC-type transport system substrate-binding protein